MAEAAALWELLGQAAGAAVAATLKTSVDSAPDRALNRINPLAFAAAHGFSEEPAIAAFVHSARLGLFDMSWNIVCPSCGGVLESGAALKALDRSEYFCSLCLADYEPTLDRLVEVTFTVNPRIRRIASHDPDSLPFAEYMRQIFWGSGAEVPEDVDTVVERLTLDAMELGPGEKAAMSLTLPKGLIIVFDPVTHSSVFLDVAGEEAHEPHSLSLLFADTRAQAPARPGAHFVRKQVRSPDAAGDMASWRRDGQALEPEPADLDRDAPAQQPNVPRPLSQRHIRS